jgi:DNA-binding NtrC family response regulator
VTPGSDTASAGLRARVQAYEAAIIHEALEAARGSRSEAARLLGIPLRTLAHKIKMLGIAEDD